ncbi:urease accessory protein UreD [Aliidongia dinghuensis]|uniref:Urease accessory protein UreD n=1 Tax=Aliidongia dinghuensis TaxID=1867774 RepID=A0A8J3E3Q4_9PROT|nr:urease accessory protein UreD [Aliidongia dinghuensis]GGF20735.1 urease accessory protein UreD [Aliidongia dinghuensis]
MPDASSALDAPALDATALERADGAARLDWVQDGLQTRIGALYQRAPARVLFPAPAPDRPAEAVLVNTAGGIAGGDRIQVEICAGTGTTALVTTAAAEKIYRARPLDAAARLETRVEVAAGAWFEWLPQETILYDGARLDRRLAFALAPGARLLAAETVLFGRAAHGEQMRHGQLLDSWALRIDGRLVWADRLRLDGDITAALGRPFGFGGAVGLTTIVHAGPDAASFLPQAREIAAAAGARGAGAEGAATLVNGVLLLRFLSRDGARLRQAAATAAMTLRHEITGLARTPPGVWRT